MPNQRPNHILQQFHRIAVQQKLSAAAILLWQHIYLEGDMQGRYTELYLRTADVLQVLGISRNGLQKVRRALTAAGLLQVRIDARQQIYYTLTIDGETVAVHTEQPKPAEKTPAKSKAQAKSKHKSQAPAKAYIPDAQYPGDIMQNDTYRKLIKSFCSRYEETERSRLETSLHHFLHKRKQQGKTLTKAGLDAILDKLVHLAEENVRTMVNIVDQSIQRGWMGVYAYSGNSGSQYRQSRPQPAMPGCSRPSRIPAYDTAYVDLSFLER